MNGALKKRLVDLRRGGPSALGLAARCRRLELMVLQPVSDGCRAPVELSSHLPQAEAALDQLAQPVCSEGSPQ
ncbi:MAG TPA: hypothetical protein VFT50_17855 [Baekduia sp.]|nr:hypothetical protein [Baekduia sp.]